MIISRLLGLRRFRQAAGFVRAGAAVLSSRAGTASRAPGRACVEEPLQLLEPRQLMAVNPIVAENQLPGTPQSVWDVTGIGDSNILGYATNISYNLGETAQFKINDIT